MRAHRGQALIELALCAPLVILLALGTVASIQVASARAGLDAATRAAAEVAARAPNAETAIAVGHERFTEVVTGYPMRSATLVLSVGDFSRTASVMASSSASIDIAWAAFLVFPARLTIRSQVRLALEPWRSHTA
jgi:Flp pilus assembly protein TadG